MGVDLDTYRQRIGSGARCGPLLSGNSKRQTLNNSLFYIILVLILFVLWLKLGPNMSDCLKIYKDWAWCAVFCVLVVLNHMIDVLLMTFKFVCLTTIAIVMTTLRKTAKSMITQLVVWWWTLLVMADTGSSLPLVNFSTAVNFTTQELFVATEYTKTTPSPLNDDNMWLSVGRFIVASFAALIALIGLSVSICRYIGRPEIVGDIEDNKNGTLTLKFKEKCCDVTAAWDYKLYGDETWHKIDENQVKYKPQGDESRNNLLHYDKKYKVTTDSNNTTLTINERECNVEKFQCVVQYSRCSRLLSKLGKSRRITLPALKLTKTAPYPVELCCKFESTKPVKWMKDNVEISSSNKYKLEIKGNLSILTISRTEEADGGLYQCVDSNSMTKFQQELRIVEGSILSLVEKTLTIATPDPVVLSCTYESEPEQVVKWWRVGDQHELPSIDKYTVETGERTSKLTINPSEVTDSGVYRCLISNDKSGSLQEIDLKLNIIKALKLTKTAPYPVELSCKFESTKPVKWMKDKVEISSSNKYKLEIKGNLSILTINRTEEADGGLYQCVDSNSMTKFQQELRIVEEKTLTITTPDPVVLSCTFESEPEQFVKWWRVGDQHELPTIDKYTVETEERTSKLTINPSEVTDSGVYCCIISNDKTGSVHEINHKLNIIKGKKALQEVQEILRDYYLQRYNTVSGIPIFPESQLLLDVIYVPLKINEKKTGNVWNKPNDAQSYDSCNELLSSGSDTKRLVIKGGPGAGKSTTCKKIAYDWANDEHDKENLSKYDLVLVLKARDFQSQQDIVQSVLKLFPAEKRDQYEDKVKTVLMDNNYKALLIIDGYDELLDKSKQDQLKELINNNMYKAFDLVITTRPWCVDDLKCQRMNIILELDKFNESKIKDFMRKYFESKGQVDSEETVDCIFKDILEKGLKSLVEVPLTCLFLCILWDYNEGALPEKKTGIYTDLIDLFKNIYKDKTKDENTEDKLKELIPQLTKLAFDKTVNDKQSLVFKKTELLDTYNIDLELACSCGLLTKCDFTKKSGSIMDQCWYSFFHSTVQEYLCAYHIYHLDCTELVMGKISDIQDIKEVENLVIFVCGLHHSSVQKKLCNTIKWELVSHLLGLLKMSHEVTNSEYGNSIKWRCLSNEFIKISEELGEGYKHRFNRVEKVSLRFDDNVENFFKKCVVSETECIPCFIWNMITKYHITHVDLYNMLCNCLYRFSTPLLASVTHITVCLCNMEGKQASIILKDANKLKYVNLSGNPFGSNSKLPRLPKSVTHIALSKCGITGQQAADMLQDTHNLEEVDLSFNDFECNTHQPLPATLKIIDMLECGITWEQAAVMLQKNHRVEEIDFSLNNLGDSELQWLPASITKINMCNCGLGNKAADRLLQRIDEPPQLKELWIKYNENISDGRKQSLRKECEAKDISHMI